MKKKELIFFIIDLKTLVVFLILFFTISCNYKNSQEIIKIKDDYIESIVDSFSNRVEINKDKGKVYTQLTISESDSFIYLLLEVVYLKSKRQTQVPFGYCITNNKDTIVVYSAMSKVFELKSNQAEKYINKIKLYDKFKLIDYPIWQIAIDKRNNSKTVLKGFTSIFKPNDSSLKFEIPPKSQ